MNVKATNNKVRNSYIDIIKGILIILVVLGHSIQWNLKSEFDNNFIFRFIYSFHMPLFILISGYIYGYVDVNKNKIIYYFNKNIKRLLLPFISWYILSYIFNLSYKNISFFDYIKKLILSPDNGLWFLWIIFSFKMLFFIIERISIKIFNKKIIIDKLIVWLLLIIMSKVSPIEILGISLLNKYYLYFILGYILNKKELLSNIFNLSKTIYLISIFGFVLLSSQWYRVQPPIILMKFRWYLNNKIFIGMEVIYQLLIVILALISMIGLIRYIVKKSSFIMNILIMLGENTLAIYAAHYYFISIFNFNNVILCITINFISGIILSLIFMKIIKRIKFAKVILLGEYK